MSADEVAVLASLLTLQAVPAKQVLAREGTVDNRLYVLVEGSLAVVKQAGTSDEAQLTCSPPATSRTNWVFSTAPSAMPRWWPRAIRACWCSSARSSRA